MERTSVVRAAEGEIMSYQSAAGYAGDLLAADAYKLLAGDASSMLIDVRTQAEWTYVGVPDLSSLGKAPLFLEWQSFPSMQVDGRFAARLSTMLETGGLKRGARLLFICRSGVRSRHGLCHVAVPRARSVGTSGIVRPLRLQSATWSSRHREARGAFGRR